MIISSILMTRNGKARVHNFGILGWLAWSLRAQDKRGRRTSGDMHHAPYTWRRPRRGSEHHFSFSFLPSGWVDVRVRCRFLTFDAQNNTSSRNKKQGFLPMMIGQTHIASVWDMTHLKNNKRINWSQDLKIMWQTVVDPKTLRSYDQVF